MIYPIYILCDKIIDKEVDYFIMNKDSGKKKLTDEHKAKIAESRKGKKQKAETIAKIKRAMIQNKQPHLTNHHLVEKSSQSRSHLTAEDVRNIRNEYSNKPDATVRSLADKHKVSRHTIHSIVTYKLWK